MEVYPIPKPGKKKKKKRGVSPERLKSIYAEVYMRDDNRCQNPYCSNGWPLDLPHHILYRSQGGKDRPDNLITLCVHCHCKIHHTATLKVSGVYPELKFETDIVSICEAILGSQVSTDPEIDKIIHNNIDDLYED
ncbi:MAG: HNH endonuclease [Desulfobacterales bacterium]|nr:HNH endonuclease [Desulfobacterales bacterium]